MTKKDNQNWHTKSYSSLLRVSSWVDSQLKIALKPFGITRAQLNVLDILVKKYPEPIDAKTLKSLLIVPNPDLTRLLDKLVSKNIVDRRTCSDNRRKIDIIITENGIEKYNEIHQIVKASIHNFFADDISEKDAKHLFQILKNIKS